MIRLLCITILLAIGSCKSQVVPSQEEKQLDITKPTIAKPKYEDFYGEEDQLSPGTARVKALITSELVPNQICNLPKKATVTITIQQLLGADAAIVNPLHTAQEVMVVVPVFMKEKIPPSGTIVTFLLSEELCPDASQTYYSIMGR